MIEELDILWEYKKKDSKLYYIFYRIDKSKNIFLAGISQKWQEKSLE